MANGTDVGNQVTGIDISPHLAPDEVPPNLELEVSCCYIQPIVISVRNLMQGNDRSQS